MPLPWDDLSFLRQAENTLSNVDGLSDGDIEAIYEEWSSRPYVDNAYGRIEALDDLQQIAVRHLLKKLGRLDELEPEPREGKE